MKLSNLESLLEIMALEEPRTPEEQIADLRKEIKSLRRALSSETGSDPEHTYYLNQSLDHAEAELHRLLKAPTPKSTKK